MNERLIIVSNRLPIQLKEKNGHISVTPSAGGLVSCIKSFLKKKMEIQGPLEPRSVSWIGAIEISKQKFQNGNLEIPDDNDFLLHPVFLSSTTHTKFYHGFCNDTIWPLFHYFPSFARFKDDSYVHYVKANEQFCEKILSVYKPGDVIWIHDYHLMLLPAMIRQHLPDAAIGFFLHIPFPSFELFRMLPAHWRVAILEGLLGADIIGFHTNSYAQYFLGTVKQLLGYETTHRTVLAPDRCVTVEVFPVGIDFGKYNCVMNQNEIFEERNRIKKQLGGAQLVFSVDRLDYTKGVINRLEGFELFLSEHPEYRQKVTLLMVIVPSREIIAKYKELKEAIEGMVGRINGRYSTLEWSPVIYQYKSIDFKKLTGLYSAADVALITPIRDGMNLVAKEFVASRSDRRGVLVLSEAAGAAAELGEALIVNPTDRRQIANALLQGLTMPVTEQMSRNDFMQKRLKNYDVVKWAEEFLTELHTAHMLQNNMRVKVLTANCELEMKKKYEESVNRILFLDYDGTLVPIARYPHLASPSKETHDLLEALSSDKRNTLVIISGRPKETLESWFGHHAISLIAEHGAYTKCAGSEWEQAPAVMGEWKVPVHQVMNMFTERCPGSFIEEKNMSLAWHYRNTEYDVGFLRSRELFTRLKELAGHLDFHVIEGKKLIEVRPRGIDKGSALTPWLNNKEHDFILAVGDDRTDEDMFRTTSPTSYTIRVGLTQSAARYNVSQQKDIPRILNNFLSSSTALLHEPQTITV